MQTIDSLYSMFSETSDHVEKRAWVVYIAFSVRTPGWYDSGTSTA